MIDLTDTAGQLIEHYSYDVFGSFKMFDTHYSPINQSQIGNTFTFTGREYDSETGLYYYRARYYDPKLGRFLSADPLGYSAGINLYSYCGNNSVNLIDPNGKEYRKKSWWEWAEWFIVRRIWDWFAPSWMDPPPGYGPLGPGDPGSYKKPEEMWT